MGRLEPDDDDDGLIGPDTVFRINLEGDTFRVLYFACRSFQPGDRLGVQPVRDLDEWERAQDGQPAPDFRLYRRGVWIVEEVIVRESNGIVLGKLSMKRLRPHDTSAEQMMNEAKACIDIGTATGLMDPYPGKGL